MHDDTNTGIGIELYQHIGIEGIYLVPKYHTLEQTWPRSSVGRALD